MSLRLLSYNIRHGGAGREKQIAGVIGACQPDVVVLQEASRPDIVERIASACGMKQWAAMRGDSLAFLSRIEIVSHSWHHVLPARRRYLEIVTAPAGLRIFGVHLSAIHSNITEWRRTYEVRALLGRTQGYRETPHVLVGDFNTLAEGAELDIRRLPPRLRALLWMGGGPVRWRTIGLMLQAGYVDAYRKLHQDGGYSFPTWDPHIRLDYLFCPAKFAGVVKKCEVVYDAPGTREASDHFPLLSEIEAPPKP